MKTYEMIAKAEVDGQTYKSGEMLYSRDTGFTRAGGEDHGADWPTTAWADYKNNKNFKIRQGLYRFAHCGGWKLADDEPEADTPVKTGTPAKKVVTISADELCEAIAEVTCKIVGKRNISAAAPLIGFGAALTAHIFDEDESEGK